MHFLSSTSTTFFGNSTCCMFEKKIRNFPTYCRMVVAEFLAVKRLCWVPARTVLVVEEGRGRACRKAVYIYHTNLPSATSTPSYFLYVMSQPPEQFSLFYLHTPQPFPPPECFLTFCPSNRFTFRRGDRSAGWLAATTMRREGGCRDS